MPGRLYPCRFIKAAIYPAAFYTLLLLTTTLQDRMYSHSGWKSKAKKGKLAAQDHKASLVPKHMLFLLTCPVSLLNS